MTERAAIERAAAYRLHVPQEVANLLHGLHPNLKQRLKRTLHTLQNDPLVGKPLREELAGLRSYRVSRFRIIYRIAEKTTIAVRFRSPAES